MKMTSFIGATFEEREKIMKESDAEYALLKEIANRIEARQQRRERATAKLTGVVEKLQAKEERDRKIWFTAMDRCIANSERICRMYDEPAEYEKKKERSA